MTVEEKKEFLIRMGYGGSCLRKENINNLGKQIVNDVVEQVEGVEKEKTEKTEKTETVEKKSNYVDKSELLHLHRIFCQAPTKC